MEAVSPLGPAPERGGLRRGGRRRCPSAAMARGAGRGRRAGSRAPPAAVSGAARARSRRPGLPGCTIVNGGGSRGERRAGDPRLKPVMGVGGAEGAGFPGAGTAGMPPG